MSQATMERPVIFIPPMPKQHSAAENAGIVKKRVAGYARVSTKEEEQKNSYDAQVSYFKQLIQSREEWEYVDVYTDKGISGTSLKKRDGFNRMVQDALDGKIDLIVLKSISRFARNTVDSLTTIRKLKAKGVGIFFEKEGINSLDDNSEMLITFMSSIAQEESHSLSKNVTWGIRKSFAGGKVWMPYKRFLGFEKGTDGLPKVVESGAEVVRYIFAQFIRGMTPSGIAAVLTQEGILSPAGKAKWTASTVKSILTNEKYRGSALLQKSFTENFLTKEKRVNEGEVEQYYIEHSHEAIIPPEVFDLVQLEIARRSRDDRRRASVSCFSNRIVCEECGNFYGRKVWHSNSKYRRFLWQCGHKFKNGTKCATPHLYETEIKAAFVSVLNGMLENREEILEGLEAAIARLLDWSGYDAKIRKAETLAGDIVLEMRREIERNARSVQDQGEYSQRYGELAGRLTAANQELEKWQNAKTERQGKLRKMQAYLEMLRERDELLPEFEEALWIGTVEEVEVHADGLMVFTFLDGSRYDYRKG